MGARCFHIWINCSEVVELQPGRDKNEEKDFFPAFILRLSTGTGK